jgi:hypothetical protein
MSGKRLSKETREGIEKDLRAGKKSMRSISVDHNCSISTVSKLAAELGLSSPRKRSKPAQQPDHSYDKPRRIAVLDRMLKSIEDTIAAGGLNTKQLFDLARSARELTTSRRGEDQLPDALDVDSSARGNRGVDPLSLVEVNDEGVPKNLQVYFSVLDIEIARDRGDGEGALAAEERVREAMKGAGFKDSEIDIDALIKAADKDHEKRGDLPAPGPAGERSATDSFAEKGYQGERLD